MNRDDKLPRTGSCYSGPGEPSHNGIRATAPFPVKISVRIWRTLGKTFNHDNSSRLSAARNIQPKFHPNRPPARHPSHKISYPYTPTIGVQRQIQTPDTAPARMLPQSPAYGTPLAQNPPYGTITVEVEEKKILRKYQIPETNKPSTRPKSVTGTGKANVFVSVPGPFSPWPGGEADVISAVSSCLFSARIRGSRLGQCHHYHSTRATPSLATPNRATIHDRCLQCHTLSTLSLDMILDKFLQHSTLSTFSRDMIQDQRLLRNIRKSVMISVDTSSRLLLNSRPVEPCRLVNLLLSLPRQTANHRNEVKRSTGVHHPSHLNGRRRLRNRVTTVHSRSDFLDFQSFLKMVQSKNTELNQTEKPKQQIASKSEPQNNNNLESPMSSPRINDKNVQSILMSNGRSFEETPIGDDEDRNCRRLIISNVWKVYILRIFSC